jgi:hypothetical protein
VNSELEQVVRNGFHKQNVERMCRVSEGLVGAGPALYGPLFLLFRLLSSQLDDQANSAERVELIRLSLQGPILDLLASQQSSAEEFRDRLGNVMRAGLAVL